MNIPIDPIYFILIISAVISLTLTLVNKLVVDQNRLKEIQKEVKEHNKKLMKANREKDQASIDKLTKDKARVMELQSEMMKMQMPVFASTFPFIIVFFLLKKLALSMAWGAFVLLPFNVPILNIGNSFTWLGWYIMCSLPFTSLFRKILNVN